jgi:hypothetical protein
MAERATLARQIGAAHTIFLWLCRRRLHVQLARQTLRRQQREAALARLRYEQDCCSHAALAEEQCRQAAAAREKALANEADERRWQDALAKEQCHYEANDQRLQDALANKRCCHEADARDAASVELTLAEEQRRRESAERAAAMVENALATEQRRQESAECATATAEIALAAEQRRQELAERAAATAEKVLANEVDEQRCQEEAAHAAASADMALAEERRCHEMVTTAAMVAEKAITQLAATLAEMASTAHEKALADEANERRRATARDKALADEANKQRRHESTERATTSATKALAVDKHNEDDDNVARRLEAYDAPLFARVDAVMAKIRAMDDGFGDWAAFGDEILAEEDDEASASAMPPSAPPTAVSPTPPCPTTYKDAVLATMGGSLCVKSLVVAPFSRPSTMVNDQPQMACCCSRPRRRIGRCHGPRAPNPLEHLLRGRRYQPSAPNQSTVNGWG